jgi:Arylsulfotransferase (ASST)
VSPADAGLTRAELLRRAGGGAVALGLAGGIGVATHRLLDSGRSEAAVNAGLRVQHFHSRPDLRPPAIEVLQRTPAAAPGHVFLAPSSGPGQRGVMILDEAGEVVWFQSTMPKTSMNLRVAVYKGKPVLTYWEALEKHALASGVHVILDDSYRELARFPAGNGLPSDLHELILTPRGTALVTSYEDRTIDLTSIGGPRDARVLGGIAQELEVPSARVVWEWRSLDHVAPGEAHSAIGHPFDCFHINSIEELPDGDFLISARNTWAVYKIDPHGGKVLWRLNGKKSDFAMGPGTGFAWQHDARRHGGARMTIYDNADNPQTEPQSRALMLHVDEGRRRVSLLKAYTHSPSALAHTMGNVQLLPNGNLMVGWGSQRWLTEFTAGGEVVFDAALPFGGENYRALRYPWVGRPVEPPALVARRVEGGRELLVSWNGATEVAAWRFQTGATSGGLVHEETRPRHRFETSFVPPRKDRHALAIALDRHGRELGRSAQIRI